MSQNTILLITIAMLLTVLWLLTRSLLGNLKK
jgi:hypothetical protein